MTTRPATATVGVLSGIAANLVWGLAFLAPVILPSVPSVTLALGRYLTFGAVSAALLAITWRRTLLGVGLRAWRTAMLFAITGHLGYYILLTQGIRWAGAPVATVIIGLLPVCVAVTGNWLRREYPFARLVPPLALITGGLTVVYAVELDWHGAIAARSTSHWALGIGATLGALVLWTSYAVMNARFLRENPHITSTTWSTMMGVCTFAFSLAALPVFLLPTAPAVVGSRGLVPLLAASTILGVVVSWLGTVLWSRSSALTPLAVAGQLAVIQVCAGLAYVFAWERRMPPTVEVIGFTVLFAGVALTIHRAHTGPARAARP